MPSEQPDSSTESSQPRETITCSDLKRECRELWRNADVRRAIDIRKENIDYQSGVQAAVTALYHTLTGESLHS